MAFQSGCGRSARAGTVGLPNSLASSSSSLQPSGNGQPIPAAAARSRYSWTVPRPIPQLRAIWRCPNPNSNRNRSNSFVFRMDILLAGTLFSSLFMESLCRVIVQRRYRLLRLGLWKTFRSKLNAIPAVGKNCSPSHRNRFHLQTGMLFGITTEWCSASDRNRVHLRPDSPSQRLAPWFSPSLMEFTPKDSSCSDENEARSLAHNEACSCNEQQ